MKKVGLTQADAKSGCAKQRTGLCGRALTIFFWIFSLTALLLSLGSRREGFLADPQLWAEDGMFLSDAFNHGFKSFFMPYAGYYHFYVRFLAYLLSKSPIPLIDFPIAFTIFWFLVFAAVVFLLFKITWLNARQKMWLVLLISMGPVSNEPFFFLCVAQIVLGLTFPMLISSCPRSSLLSQVLMLLIFLFAALSGPYIILLTPIILFISGREILRKKKIAYHSCLLAMTLIAFGLQMIVDKSRVPVESKLLELDALRPFALTYSNIFMGFYANFLDATGWLMVSIVAGALLLFLFIDSFRRNQMFVCVCIYFSVTTILAATYACRNNPASINPWHMAERYFFVPTVTIVWAIACYAWTHPRPFVKKFGYLFCLYQFTIFALDLHRYQESTKITSFEWRNRIRAIDEDATYVEIPIDPPGFRVIIENLSGKRLY